MADAAIHEEDAIGKAYDGRLMRRLMRYVRPYGWLVAVSLVLLMVDGALQLVGPVLTQRVIDVALPRHDVALATEAALLFAGSLVVGFGAQWGQTILTALLGQRVMRDLRNDIFAHLQRLPIRFFDRTPVGRLVTRTTADVESLNELFTAGVVAGLGDLFTLLAIGVMMLVMDWRLALAAFAVIPFIYLSSALFRRAVRTSYRDIRTRLARINAFLNERLTGMRILQLFGMQRAEARRFDELNERYLDANLRAIVYYAVYFPVIEVLTSVALASLLVAGAHRVQVGALTVGTVAAFLQLVRRFFQPLQDLSDKFNTLQQAMAASERIFKLLDEPMADTAEGAAAGAGVAAAGAVAVADAVAGADGLRGSRAVTIVFDHVWFAYDPPGTPEADLRWVLRDVSFTVGPGQTIALVGHTGAGKTTVVNLLLRFYDPQRGRITVNGVDTRDVPAAVLRGLIGYVQQDIFLFAGDVAGNIRLSAPLSDDDVRRAAERVGADRIIARFPDGYAHALGERGGAVSVGERQLLSFARAIAADPAVLVLDEATSAVDSEIESEIQHALSELVSGRTTIAIAHRLSTIVDADEILVLHHGQVAERGTHRTLLDRHGLYDRLYRLQAGGAPPRSPANRLPASGVLG
ncbi:MAG TPA: ABC transporter ATP-binding protein [Gemmatimonadaceae bacterium]|nr:ABC transporter ATP-binding protein [Gemmatimonadaceae bacterium]